MDGRTMSLIGWWRSLVDEPGLLGRIRRQWPWVVMVVTMAAGLVLIALYHYRRGPVLIGVALIFGGICRLAMRDPGILAIRQHRWIDALFYFGLGLGLIVIALVVPGPA